MERGTQARVRQAAALDERRRDLQPFLREHARQYGAGFACLQARSSTPTSPSARFAASTHREAALLFQCQTTHPLSGSRRLAHGAARSRNSA